MWWEFRQETLRVMYRPKKLSTIMPGVRKSKCALTTNKLRDAVYVTSQFVEANTWGLKTKGATQRCPSKTRVLKALLSHCGQATLGSLFTGLLESQNWGLQLIVPAQNQPNHKHAETPQGGTTGAYSGPLLLLTRACVYFLGRTGGAPIRTAKQAVCKGFTMSSGG